MKFQMKNWDQLATDDSIKKVIDALRQAQIEVVVVENGKEAKEKVLDILPKDVEVMTMQSMTLKDIGLAEAIDELGNYKSVRKELSSMDRTTQGQEMSKLGAAPEWSIGSIHAVTEDGKVVVASNTGSQLGAYAYGASRVVWVVGTQKIVKNLDAGMERIYDYILPLESKRLSKALGKEVTSDVSKVLIFNKEVRPGRITMILVKEKLGF